MVNKNLIKLKEILDKSNIDYDYNKILKDLKKDLKNKKYGLIWEESGEKEDKLLENNVPIFKEEKALRIENTKKGPNHIIIEGDNLLGLKSLETSKKKVDVIYIDPPYNTGNEFIYNDKLVDKDDSYRHSKWLSFMHKRLKVARELLKDDGVIFISIDDNEQAQLKLLMNEIFGEDNFIETFLWNHNIAGSSISNFSRKTLEYIHCYAKNKKKINYKFKHKIKNDDTKASLYNKPNKYNDLVFKKGSIFFKNKKNRIIKKFKEKDLELKTDIVVEKGVNTNDVVISSRWKWSQEYLNKQLSLGNVIYAATDKLRLNYVKKNNERIISPTKLLQNVGLSRTGGVELNKYELDFSYPKPVSLIRYLIDMVTYHKPNAIVLDFFAGSGTTLQAVMELNKEDGGNRQCILINNNEVSNTETAKFLNKNYNTGFELTKSGKLSKRKSNLEKFNKFLKTDKFKKIKEGHAYKNLGICRSVTYKRGKRVIQGYQNNKGDKIAGLNNNNLYYYEIKLLSKNLTEFEVLDKLKTFAVELIKIKHDAFYLKEVSKDKDRAFYTGKEDVIVSHKIYVDDDFADYVNKRITNKPMNVYIDESLLNDIKLANLNTKNIYPIPEKFINWEGISRKESIA